MKWFIKLFIIYSLQVVLRVFYIFPIKKNRILFSANGGASYLCNPKYIFEALYEKWGGSLEYIWCIKDKTKIPKKYKIKIVKPLSLRHLYYLMTSRVVIANVGIEPFVPPRNDRIFINTWHGGGAYKKGGLSATYYSKAHMHYFKAIRNLRAKSTTYLISSNRRFSEIFEYEFRLEPKKILPIGMPRNDVFFTSQSNQNKFRTRICNQYKIAADSFIILYAPTYRGHESHANRVDWTIDTDAIVKAAKDRFGKEIVVLYRCHFNVFNKRQNVSHSIDVSEYPDMQELLASVDFLISDYSSLIWDFAMTSKPGFLYTPDLEEYCSVTKLHTPIEQWQYPYSRSTEELCNQIRNYDPSKALDKINAHLKLLGSYERGVATKEICKIIEIAIFEDK